MKRFFLFLSFLTTGCLGNAQIFSEQEGFYQRALPPDIYAYSKEHHFFDENVLENRRENKLANGTAKLIMKKIDGEEGTERVEIRYFPAIDEGWVEWRGYYSNQKLHMFVFFDNEGRDYLPLPPITDEASWYAPPVVTKELEEEMQAFVLGYIFPVMANEPIQF